jgi:hypothetical protein
MGPRRRAALAPPAATTRALLKLAFETGWLAAMNYRADEKR